MRASRLLPAAIAVVEREAAPPDAAALLAGARARWEASRAAHKHVLLIAAEARAGNSADAGALAGIISESQDAAGNLQALQAGNQISALTTQQLMQVEAP